MIPLIKVAMPDPKVLLPALEKVLYSGMIAEGSEVYAFENQFSRRFGLPNVLAMNSGTAALHAALTLAGVLPGDEVISTSMTAEPTNTSVLYCGAKVIWADVDPSSGNICPDSVRSLINQKTKAIICVHYAGYPARLNELRKIADEFNICLIEDCAHALGAKYDTSSVGMIGDYGIFSFQAIKHMTTVDGGMLVLKNPERLVEAKKFRWFGMLKGVPRTEIDVASVGYKYNMNNVTATIGSVQLSIIDSVLSRYIENGKYFDMHIAKIPGLSFARSEGIAESSYWLYTLLTDRSEEVERCLNAAGVTASKLHRPNHLHSIFSSSARYLPNLESFYKRLVHLPCGWWVTDEDRQFIVETLQRG